MSKRWLLGNWKLNKTCAEAEAFVKGLIQELPKLSENLTWVIAPPHTALHTVATLARGSALMAAAQNIYAQDSGAFTGEVSAPLAAEAGAQYTLVGHSERRALFGETDADCAQKLAAAAQAGLCPILCVGESAQERQRAETAQVVRKQLGTACSRYLSQRLGPLIVAYEPIWAIGTGLTAAPEDCEAVHALMGETLDAMMPQPGINVPLVYGGSVTADNAASFVAMPHIDGVLVGGASLRLDSFVRIALAIGR